MSKKQSSRALDYSIYLAVRVLVCILQALPFRAACNFASFLGWALFHVNKRHREVARDNLRHAFPGRWDRAGEDAMILGIYRHFCLFLVEFLHAARRLHQDNWSRYLRFRSPKDAETMVNVLLSGRPVLMATGHFGNWELSSHLLGLLGFKINAIARPLDNPYLDDYMRRYRESQGQAILDKQGDFDKILGVLQSGGILGTLADQDAGQKGLYVDFFNRPASTHKAVALMALEHNVILVVSTMARVGGPLEYHICVEDVIYPEEYADQPGAIKAMTQRYMSALERLIRLYPEQYFWLHRRWKHQPAEKKSKQAAA